MILTASPITHAHSYTPLHSSPLSERSINVAPHSSFHYASPLMMSSSSSYQENAQKNVPFSKRAVKVAPVVKDKDTVRERRRDLFLKKVAQNRDERRWEQRGDQILRLDCLKEQRRWEAEKARSAPSFEDLLLEQDEGPAMSSKQPEPSFWQQQQQRIFYSHFNSSQPMLDPSEEAEELAELERRELEELAAMAEPEQAWGGKHAAPSHFGSDDEDYDNLFMDFLSGQENHQPRSNQPGDGDYRQLMENDDAMDISS